MATIAHAEGKGSLTLFELPEYESRLPIRSLHLASPLLLWIENTSELDDVQHAEGGRLLIEHLIQSLCDFRCSQRPSAGELRRVMPTGDGIWKLHTVGLRLYGWCPQPHALVLASGALAVQTKADRKLNDEKRKEVISFIRKNKLERTVIRGDHRDLFPPQN